MSETTPSLRWLVDSDSMKRLFSYVEAGERLAQAVEALLGPHTDDEVEAARQALLNWNNQ